MSKNEIKKGTFGRFFWAVGLASPEKHLDTSFFLVRFRSEGGVCVSKGKSNNKSDRISEITGNNG